MKLALCLISLAVAPADGAFLRSGSISRRPQHRHLRATPVACEPPSDPEEVTRKYGLEAGLFSALRNKQEGAQDGGKATVKPGDLLKRYGGAYLLTSTSLAVVSFTLCYAAVSNGVDVTALLERVGIQVSSTSETAGTVGLAYAIHKAASPIRFPPTVALTPVVARKLFGKTDDAPEGDAEEGDAQV